MSRLSTFLNLGKFKLGVCQKIVDAAGVILRNVVHLSKLLALRDCLMNSHRDMCRLTWISGNLTRRSPLAVFEHVFFLCWSVMTLVHSSLA